jgi:membrane associated rhomboid family serine protease
VVRGTGGGGSGFERFPATYVLIAINVIVYLVEVASGPGGINNPGGSFVLDYGLYGPFVAEGEVYRLLTSGFLHASLFHVGFNMLLLFFLGRLLEPALGTPRYLLLYLASLLAGSFGVLLIDPESLTLGASGAVFGLAGAVFVIARGRGMDAIAGEIGFLIVFNLIWTFATPRHISVGAHVGGLVGGILCALAIVAGERGTFGRNRAVFEYLVLAAVAVVSVLGSIAVA